MHPAMVMFLLECAMTNGETRTAIIKTVEEMRAALVSWNNEMESLLPGSTRKPTYHARTDAGADAQKTYAATDTGADPRGGISYLHTMD